MSRPARGKLLLVMTFVLTLCAGIVVGIALSKQVIAGPVTAPPGSRPAPPSNPSSWFADKLKLSPAQTEQMKTIWSDAMSTGREHYDHRRSLYRERDAAIEALYTDEQRSERERIKKEYEAKLAENSRQREKLVQVAVEKTKAMLSPAQREAYEQILRERAERDRHRGPSTRSSTQPSDRPPGPPFGPPQGRFDRRRGGEEPRGGDFREGEPRGGEYRDGDDNRSERREPLPVNRSRIATSPAPRRGVAPRRRGCRQHRARRRLSSGKFELASGARCTSELPVSSFSSGGLSCDCPFARNW